MHGVRRALEKMVADGGEGLYSHAASKKDAELKNKKSLTLGEL